ncbi:hypothetical protein CMQ_2139 [Grosmannia clavigera kw1407]|uniref:Uncharacterized protein n=1 Tax=Grosmannia clavigera (strain kw1407 / UAMH 11150) TaxID=655863 RepID=F0XJ43_GROCL|nr:uncharacterized protein CMQ_2139 [Grosmannia clavigera kw1407]EFX02090.1 hypothetical protein CMQ_2139 [Grosmannia clavigera kw1407]
MSSSRYADDTERQAPISGSIRRARERAAAGMPREDFTFPTRMGPPPQHQQSSMRQPSRIPPPRSTGGPLQMKNGQIGVAISNPTPAAQWPLAGPLAAPSNLSSNDAEPYRPPPGRSQPPQRPPRPSNVPSILDASRIQDLTPSVFPYGAGTSSNTYNNNSFAAPPPMGDRPGRRPDMYFGQQSMASPTSRPSTVSSVGSIPDFPIPVTPVAILAPPPIPIQPRRSVTLGPPPSARRGASSFYSSASFVSPIPEESPRSRSHTSLASSAAMPESWGTESSPSLSPNYTVESTYYEDIIPEDGQESFVFGNGYYEDERGSGASSPNSDDGKRLVRSASLGKRAKAALVTTGGSRLSQNSQSRASNAGPFFEDTSYSNPSASSSASNITAPPRAAPARSTLTASSILEAYEAASELNLAHPNRPPSSNPSNYNNDSNSESTRDYSRRSAIRRPPRIDLDAVRKAEARGSLTSLPDLIKRATRLAASLDRGHRPASRMNEYSMSPGMYGAIDKEMGIERDKHQSGLSDMLAAFPPPAQAGRRSFRDQIGSWPLPLIGGRQGNLSPYNGDSDRMDGQQQRKGRRCCGLPRWGALLLLFVVLVIVAAAIVIPLEFLVIHKKSTSSATAKCEKQLICLNGGTNFVSDAGSGLTNITIGDALPRLIEQAQLNFSIPLSGTQILAMLNAGNLSCTAENALVTFDGETVRQSDGSTEVSDAVVNAAVSKNEDVDVANAVQIMTVTVMSGSNAAITISPSTETVVVGTDTSGTLITQEGLTISIAASDLLKPTSTTTTTVTVTPTSTASGGSKSTSKSTSTASKTSTRSSTTTTASSASTATFTVTEEVLDFARVAVLYILQEESLANAETAQTALQKFFSSASNGVRNKTTGVTLEEARNLTLSNGNSVNLETFKVAVTAGLGGTVKRRSGVESWFG